MARKRAINSSMGKWLDQVIINPCIERLYAISDLVMSGEHQDGCGHTVGVLRMR